MVQKSISLARLRQVRRAFESGLAPVPLLARGLGVTPATFRKLMREKGWIQNTATDQHVVTARPQQRRRTPQTVAKTIAAPAHIDVRADDPQTAEDHLEAGTLSASALDTGAIARRVEATLVHEISSVGNALARPDTQIVERDARFLTSLVKAVVELRRLENAEATPRRKGGHDRAERPPRDMAALRADLIAKLERLQVSGPGR